ncbi:type 1 glutamine amidotransferase [Microbacterium thalassium]|uniref:GMP synthase (Glutamine-hydrolyzing) n=1 Tax=Microbacterium thalassium TaxID=362649 RepID=A0A7X0FM03_9MICO|nr:type 1 glutamine amidotransferase [Microbacterium thalassium]MBB6389963.1 GMP synthase (glutamine-hydrolyzing) [Microbacterium thalassium]GLK24649.1 glutamine amidotransferase [Microbacterium thalassium]
MGISRTIRIAVVQPDDKCDLDRMGEWLEQDGVELRVIRPFAGDAVPASIHDDALIVLGGAMGVHDGDAYPYIDDIKSLLRATADADLPTLGVCLGAQLLADALGGEVAVGGEGLESGLVRIRLLDDAVGDPLVKSLPAQMLMPSLHFDAITRLPRDAVLLGTGEVYPNQVFRVGSSWGVQFHPEISPTRFVEWRDEVPMPLLAEVDAQAREFESADTAVSDDARHLTRGFVGIVRGRRADAGSRDGHS